MKTFGVITASLGLLTNNQAIAAPLYNDENNATDNSEYITFKRMPNEKLVLKINPNNLEDGKLIAYIVHTALIGLTVHTELTVRITHLLIRVIQIEVGGGYGVGALLVVGLVTASAYQLEKIIEIRNKDLNYG